MKKNLLKMFRRKPIASFIALSLGLTANVSFAQDAQTTEDADEQGLEVIMVTASKRQTGLQQTPIAVTVTSAKAIQETKILDIQDLQALVPTLRVTPLQRSTNTNFSIRGFGNGTNNTGIEPSVGVFIDGVYRSRAAAQIGDLPRLEQIEVLSGPQSTLFGKNASAGVINVRTAAPSFDSEGKIEFGAGNYHQSLLRGYYTNGISDTVAASISGSINKRDGYTDSLVGLGKLNDRDRVNIRGQLLYEPNEDVTVRLIADSSEISEACCTVANVINGASAGGIRFLGGVILDDSDPFSYTSALNVDPVNNVKDHGVSVQLDVDFDSFVLTSITAMRNNDSDFIADVDFTSLAFLTEVGHTEIDTFTQELRLTSTGKGDFSWMAGAFFFQEDLVTGDTLSFGSDARNYLNVLGLQSALGGIEQLFGLAPNTFFAEGPALNSEFTQENDALSLFVSLDYKLTEDLTATVGLSYTNDEKQVSIESVNNAAFSNVDLSNDITAFGIPVSMIPDAAIPGLAAAVPLLKRFQFLPPHIEFPNSVEDGKTDDSKSTYSLRLAYELNKNFNFFATAATGFKASSWNLSRDTRPFPGDQSALTTAGLIQKNQNYGTRFARPEESTVYELGMKSRFKSGALNITLFDQTIDGFQSSTFIGTGFVLANAGQQSTKGIEFDSVYRPFDAISLSFAGTLLDPVYDSFVGASGLTGPVDLSGQTPAGIHERSFTFGIKYEFDLDSGAYGYVRSDYLYESEVELVSNVPASMTREVGTINASAGLTLENGISMQLWVRNLNNDEYFMSAFPPPVQQGTFNAYPNQPRTFGASVSYEF